MHCPLLELHSFLPMAMCNKNYHLEKSSRRVLIQDIGQDCVSRCLSLQLSRGKSVQLREATSYYHNHISLSEGCLMR